MFVNAIQEDGMMQTLALELVAEFQRYAVRHKKHNIIDCLCVLNAMVLLDMGSTALVGYMGSAISGLIPEFNSWNVLQVLCALSIKDVFDDPRMVQRVADHALALLQRNSIQSHLFPHFLHTLAKLNFAAESHVVKQFRAAARRDGITQNELNRFGDPLLLILRGETSGPKS